MNVDDFNIKELGKNLFSNNVITNFVVSIIYSNYSTWVNTDGGYFLFILFIFVMLFTIYLDKYIINEKSKSIYLCFFVAIILQVLAISSNPFARLVLDYYIVLIVMIPNSIMDTKILTEKQKSLLCIGTIIAISIFFIYLWHNDTSLFSYKFLWQ